MRYLDSIADFFRSPKWGMNLLFESICVLVPIVGPIVLIGYHLDAFVRQGHDRNNPRPDFDFGRFGDYLSMGAWPFVVNLVASLCLVPLMFLLLLPLVILPALDCSPALIGVVGVICGVLYLVLALGLSCLMVPLMLRGGLTQSFGGAFSLAFVRSFLRLVWLETLLTFLFLMVVGSVLGMLGYLLLCVGIYPAMALVIFANWHLFWQLYGLYLQRGGEAVVLGGKLISD